MCIRKQLEYELETSYTGQEVLQEIANKEEALWAKCIQINENWNAEVAIARDERLAKEREAQRKIILAQLIEKEEEKKQKLEAIEEIVRLEKVCICLTYKLYVIVFNICTCMYLFFLGKIKNLHNY